MGKIVKYDKITFVIPHIDIGGAERVVMDLVTEATKKNISCTLLVLGEKRENAFESILEDSGVDVTYCNVKGRVSFRNYFRVSRELIRSNPSFLSVHLDKRYSIFWAIIHRKKYAFTIHSSPERINDRITRLLFRVSKYMNIVKFVGVSKIISQKMESIFNLDKGEVVTIINPVKLAENSKRKVTNDKVKFVTVARLTAIKNQKLLIDAFCQSHQIYQNIQLEIIGDGEEYGNLEEQIKRKQADSYIKLLGRHYNVTEFLKNSDVFILTSLSEALPISILEAMTYSLPIISSNVGGVSEIVTDNGLLFESDDIKSLVDTIVYLATNYHVREIMSKNSLKNVEVFSIEKVLERYLEVFREFKNV